MHLNIEPAEAGVYAARTRLFEVRLRDRREDAQVEVFAGSAIEIRRLSDGQACSVEGDVWARCFVFVSANKRTLMVLESSGSNDSLLFVDTRNCMRRAEIDVSSARWEVRAADLIVTPVAPTAGRPGRRPAPSAVPDRKD